MPRSEKDKFFKECGKSYRDERNILAAFLRNVSCRFSLIFLRYFLVDISDSSGMKDRRAMLP